MLKFVVNFIFNFLIIVLFMVGIIFLMYKMILRKYKNNILLLLLVGMVILIFVLNYVLFL